MPTVLSDIHPDELRENQREWWYNALDCCVTLEVHEILSRKNQSTNVYDFERSLQGPALDMMLRGFRIDPIWQSISIEKLVKLDQKVQGLIDRLSWEIWGKPLNPRSPKQLAEFFFDTMNLPPVWISFRGERKISTNREALEKLSEYYIAQPIINLIFLARDTGKKLSVLRAGVDPDGRMRCTYNVCGTETGRWASSQNVWGRGTNLQNITPELRRMFVADPGMVLVIIDGEQAESHAVGFIHGRVFDDWRYLDACEAGDLHTTVARLVWPDLSWTGNNKLDREIADRVFYRWFTFRDFSKRGGHATNYYGQPYTVARNLKVPKDLIERFQVKYLKAFGMQAWWQWVAHELGTRQSITTFVGRERTFYGRPNDDATLREAIAYEPQSAVGDLVNEGGYRIWRAFPSAQPLGQYHDAWCFQVPVGQANDLIPKMIAAFEIPVTTRNRTMKIPGEAKIGWNWAANEMSTPLAKRTFADGNPDGLTKWSGHLNRVRLENPEASLLDRVIC